MTTGDLRTLFQYNHYVIGVNARDLTHEESLIGPDTAGNCANWVLGHIVQNRGAVLELLGEKPVWVAAEGERYKRGSVPITGGAEARPFAEIFQALDLSQERLATGLSRVTDSDLGAALRRIVGKKGAIA